MYETDILPPSTFILITPMCNCTSTDLLEVHTKWQDRCSRLRRHIWSTRFCIKQLYNFQFSCFFHIPLIALKLNSRSDTRANDETNNIKLIGKSRIAHGLLQHGRRTNSSAVRLAEVPSSNVLLIQHLSIHDCKSSIC